MNADQRLAITVSADLADAMRRRIETGEFGSAEEMVREGLKRLLDDGDGLEAWLREEVVAGHAEYLADPSLAVDAENLLPHLQARRQQRAATPKP